MLEQSKGCKRVRQHQTRTWYGEGSEEPVEVSEQRNMMRVMFRQVDTEKKSEGY